MIPAGPGGDRPRTLDDPIRESGPDSTDRDFVQRRSWLNAKWRLGCAVGGAASSDGQLPVSLGSARSPTYAATQRTDDWPPLVVGPRPEPNRHVRLDADQRRAIAARSMSEPPSRRRHQWSLDSRAVRPYGTDADRRRVRFVMKKRSVEGKHPGSHERKCGGGKRSGLGGERDPHRNNARLLLSLWPLPRQS
jgi:hypothetical protein